MTSTSQSEARAPFVPRDFLAPSGPVHQQVLTKIYDIAPEGCHDIAKEAVRYAQHRALAALGDKVGRVYINASRYVERLWTLAQPVRKPVRDEMRTRFVKLRDSLQEYAESRFGDIRGQFLEELFVPTEGRDAPHLTAPSAIHYRNNMRVVSKKEGGNILLTYRERGWLRAMTEELATMHRRDDGHEGRKEVEDPLVLLLVEVADFEIQFATIPEAPKRRRLVGSG